jgi:secondary thiamine-phosphate synthase enzyme
MESPVAVVPTGFVSYRIPLRTSTARQFIDITEEVEDRVAQSGFRTGLAVVSSLHTTAAIVINEHEPELLKDLDEFLIRLAPHTAEYLHNDVPHGIGEQPNGHAHCQALLLNSSATIPIVEGRMALGRYQRIFLVELDFSRPRSVAVTLLGA